MGIFWVTSFLEKSDGKIISSGHNDFDADGFFGAYVFAPPTTEASFFIDDLNDIIPALNLEDRTDFHTGPTGCTVIKNFNNRLHGNPL